MPEAPRTPAQVDTELADLHEAHDKAWRDRDNLVDFLHGQVGDKYTRDYSRSRQGETVWVMSEDEVLAKAGDMYAEQKRDLDYGTRLTTTMEKLEAAQAAAYKAHQGILACNEEFLAAGGWSRFFLALSSDGHVHSSTECSTLHHGAERTRLAWLPELSGKTEDDAVTEFGEKMCTLCFPSAPANPAFHAPGRRDQAVIDARDAEKAARTAAKITKGITADGSELRLPSGDTTKTLIGAQRLLQKLGDAAWYRAVNIKTGDDRPHPSEPEWLTDADALVAAIAAKTGEDPETIRAAAQAKADRKTEKDLR